MDFPDFLQKGFPFLKIRGWLNRVLRAAKSQRLMPGSTGVRVQQLPGGQALWIVSDQTISVILSGSNSPYSGTLVLDDMDGGHQDLPTTFTDNIYEVNNVSGLDGMVIDEVYRSIAEDAWKFQWVGIGTSKPKHPDPCVFCPEGIPLVLTLTFNPTFTPPPGHPSLTFTLTFGHFPGVGTGAPTAMGWWSELWSNVFGGDTLQHVYQLVGIPSPVDGFCIFAIIAWNRDVTAGTSWVNDGAGGTSFHVAWDPRSPMNKCDPFSFLDGFDQFGHPPPNPATLVG